MGSVLSWLNSRLRQRGIVAIFSDFFDDLEQIVDGLRRLVHAGHEPILFHVLDPLELSFDLDHMVRLDGLEGSGTLKIDPKQIRTAYLEEIGKHNHALVREASVLNIDYVELRTDVPVDVVLSTYLARRLARVRGRRA